MGGSRWTQLQPLLPRNWYCHGSCSLQRARRVRGWNPSFNITNGKGCHRILELGRGARDGQRKKMGLKVLAISSVLFALSVWVKRYKWVTIKTRKIAYDPPKMGGRH